MVFFKYAIVFVVIWWVAFFVALPFGVRGQFEAGKVAPGTEPAAPENPKLRPKLLASTIAAAVGTFLVWLATAFHWFDVFFRS